MFNAVCDVIPTDMDNIDMYIRKEIYTNVRCLEVSTIVVNKTHFLWTRSSFWTLKIPGEFMRQR